MLLWLDRLRAGKREKKIINVIKRINYYYVVLVKKKEKTKPHF